MTLAFPKFRLLDLSVAGLGFFAGTAAAKEPP